MTQLQDIKSFSVFLLMILVFLSGALIFLKGFLLTRTVVDTKSSCEPDFAKTVNPPAHTHEIEGCWMHGRFKRAIIIIIDALRYDFLVYNRTSSDKDVVPPYLNKFESIDYLLTRKPLNSRLYKFKADPPTTTMQRIKGLTTGSLPTFVDVSSNFKGYEITEDSLLNQLNVAKRKITFLGDDTWLGLFPKMFHKSFDFPSFDVKDLHTVDNGILKNLYPEMRKKDWDVIIAHFLGVDHCGHRFGPNHPSMADKLSQMDTVIGSVTNLMKNDTILFVMGDHGMTRTGDHGGDSDDELMAGMFIYSPSQIASSPQKRLDDIVLQTDFVPTFSLLLGAPIPFSNLGMVIPELFGHCPWWNTDSNEVKRVFHRVKALRLNAQQVDNYLDSYQLVSSDLPRKQLRSLKESMQKSEKDLQMLMTLVASGKSGSDTLHRLLDLEKSYISYLSISRKMCENVWAKFDLKMISVGISTMVLGIVLSIYFFIMFTEEKEKDSSPLIPFIIYGTILYLVYLAVDVFLLPEGVPPVMAFVISFVLIFICYISSKIKVMAYFRQAFSNLNAAAILIALISCLLFFSNSFLVHEDRISLFLLQSLLFIMWLKIAMTNHSPRPDVPKSLTNKNSKRTKSFDISQYLLQPSFIATITVFMCSLFIRLSANFYDCREEQHECQGSFFLTPISNLDSTSKNQRYLLSTFCIGAIVYLSRYWLKFYGNLNGTSVPIVCLSYAPSVAATCTCLHWAFQTLPETTLDRIPQWQQVIMAQAVYAAVIVSLIAISLSPLFIYVLPSRQDPYMDLSKGTIPSLYNQIKLKMTHDEEEKPPTVYGLGSVYSASVIALCLIFSLLFCLLLNDGIAPSVLCAVVALYFALELYSACVISDKSQRSEEDFGSQDPTWYGIVLLGIFSTVFFYATGHQATVANIRFGAAFVGFYGDFNSFILPGFLIWTNTFASHIFVGMASPLLIFWPRLSSALVLRMMKEQKVKRTQEGNWQGDFELFNDGIQFRKKLFQLFTGLLLFYGSKMLLGACAATMHRRHLMVWKIFAPRFIYEAAMFATIAFYLSLSFLFVIRVDAALSRFVKTLPSHKEVAKD